MQLHIQHQCDFVSNPFQMDLDLRNDRLKRNELLTTYIHYQAHLPHPSADPQSSTKTQHRPGFSMTDNEVNDIIAGDSGENCSL